MRLVLAAIFILLAGCSPLRIHEARLVLIDLAAGSHDSALKRSTPAPNRATIAYEVDGRARQGDLYRPGESHGAAAVVLVPGAARTGKDDPRLVGLAETLARARFSVLVPEIATLRELRVGPGDADHVADAVRNLDAIGSAPIGIVAISYAVAPAVIAALREDVNPRLDFIVGVGGYYDLEAVVTFFTTGFYRDGAVAPWRWRAPNAYGKWVFVRGNADRLDDSGDRVLLAAIAERKLEDLDAPVEDLTAKLGPQGRSVHDLVQNRDPERVPGLIARLPAGIRSDMAALDLSRLDLANLRARLHLVHGRDDAIIPVTESRALARAAGPRADLTEVDSLAHADLGAAGIRDAAALLRVVYRVLAERDQPPRRLGGGRRAGDRLELAARAASGQW
ncbi:MAG: alpha/beta hydrolase [Rhodospirillales bacterium]|nr:alpha/beta hydrolase [Rhodospirillales bacterium]